MKARNWISRIMTKYTALKYAVNLWQHKGMPCFKSHIKLDSSEEKLQIWSVLRLADIWVRRSSFSPDHESIQINVTISFCPFCLSLYSNFLHFLKSFPFRIGWISFIGIPESRYDKEWTPRWHEAGMKHPGFVLCQFWRIPDHWAGSSML